MVKKFIRRRIQQIINSLVETNNIWLNRNFLAWSRVYSSSESIRVLKIAKQNIYVNKVNLLKVYKFKIWVFPYAIEENKELVYWLGLG